MNDDGQPLGDITLHRGNSGPMTKENFLNTRESDLKNSPIDAIFYDWHPISGVTDFIDYSPEDVKRLSKHYNNGKLIIDPQKSYNFWLNGLQMMIDYGHSCGKEVFFSMRMNDTHDMVPQNAHLLSNWKRANLDKLMGPPYVRTPYGEGRWSALDYGNPVVRDRIYECIKYVCEKHPDLDGIELDFLRHPHFFKPQMYGQPVTQEQCDQMTALVKRIHELAVQIEKKRNRPFLVAVRIQGSIGYSKAIGLDVQQWLKDGLVDMVIASCYMIFEPWKNLAEFCHKYNVPFYACISASRLKKFGPYTQRFAEEEALYAWNQGVDGIYTFNLFDTRQRHYKSIGDREKLNRMKLVKNYKPILIGQSGYDRMLKDGSRYLHIVDISATPYFIDSTEITLKSRVPDYLIHYTLDGRLPTVKSPVYAKPIILDSSAKLRVKAYSKNGTKETFESMMDFLRCDKIYSPAVKFPIKFSKLPVGTFKDIEFDIKDPPQKGVPLLNISAADVDSVDEVHVFLNDKNIKLPQKIVDDTQEKTACIPFDRAWLKDGKNKLRVVFNSDLNGKTSGFEVRDIKILIVPQK